MKTDISNESFWHELYRYEAPVFAYIKNAVGDAEIARDLFQDVYHAAIKNFASYDSGRSLKNWLFTITRNRVVNYYRYHKRRELVEFDESTIQVGIQHDDKLDILHAALDRLPERQKKILLLREIDGFSYDKIARHLGLSVPAVTALLSRARENFQKEYLLHFMPGWLARIAREINLSDLFRFVNPFNPPLDVIDIIDKKRGNYFSTVTADWDEIRDNYISDRDLEYILQKIERKSQAKVADLGCGKGFVSIPLSLHGMQVYAVDVNREMIDALAETKKRLGLDNLQLVRADLRQLPMHASNLDFIFLVLALHHIPDPFALITGCQDLLVKGGELIIVDFMRHRQRDMADHKHDLWLGFNPDSIKKRLKNSKLKLVSDEKFTENKKIPSFFQIWQKDL